MQDGKLILALNFTLFTVLLVALLYTIFAISFDNGSTVPWNDFRVFRDSTQFVSHSLVISESEGSMLPLNVSKEVEFKLKVYAQYAAIASYCTTYPKPSPCLKNWNNCTQLLAKADPPKLSPPLTQGTLVLYNFSTYTHSWTGGEGFMALESSGDKLVVAFGGSTVLLDWFNDFRAWTTPFYPIDDDLDLQNSFWADTRVHAGIYDIYKSFRYRLSMRLNSILHKHKVREISFTGHSLGGSLASLFALDIRNCQAKIVTGANCLISISPNVPIAVYTYGQPRFGNSALMEFYESLMNNQLGLSSGTFYRVLNPHDIVTVLPPMFLGYRNYPGIFYSVSQEKQLLVCADDQQPYCSFKGFTQLGHVSYIWNFDDVKKFCRKL